MLLTCTAYFYILEAHWQTCTHIYRDASFIIYGIRGIFLFSANSFILTLYSAPLSSSGTYPLIIPTSPVSLSSFILPDHLSDLRSPIISLPVPFNLWKAMFFFTQCLHLIIFFPFPCKPPHLPYPLFYTLF